MRPHAAALLLAGVLTGCTASTGEAIRPAAEGATRGGILRVGITAPGSVDPGNVYEPMGDLVVRTMCDPLIAADPLTGELKPSLAESWVVSDSGQRLVIRLRKGLRFSDGSRLTSDDVAYSLSRIASADYASAAASRLDAIDGYAEVHGDAETDDDAERRRLRGVRTLDEQSVEITLNTRRGDFLRLLTSPLTSPVPQASASRGAAAFARQPICSGPYSLAAPYRSGDPVVRLARVPDYRPADTSLTAGGRGYADTIELRVFPDARAAAAAARTGQVDVAAAAATDQARVQSAPGASVEYLGFPTSVAPVFDKVVVRRALALALDRQALVDEVFPGTRVPATGFLPPSALPTFVADACKALPVRGDVTKAKALLRREGVDLRSVRAPIYVNPDGRNAAMVRAVAAQWKATLGFTAVPTALSFDAFVARGTSVKGFDGPFRFSWSTPYADPDGVLYPVFSTERVGRDNFARYSSPAFDRVLVRLAREAEAEADRELEYRHAEQVLCDDVPMLPLTFSLSRYLVAARVGSAAQGYVDRTSGQPLLRELYLR